MTHDYLDSIADEHAIIGAHLKCPKGNWMENGAPLKTGRDGARYAILPLTAKAGEIRFENGKPVEVRARPTTEGGRPPQPLSSGFDAYMLFHCIRMDEPHVGKLCTFTGTGWGGWKAYRGVLAQWKLMRRKRIPIATLATKERHDQNKNIDPLFEICGWADPADFPDLMEPESSQPQLSAPPSRIAPELPPPRLDEPPPEDAGFPEVIDAAIDDDILF